MTERQQQQQMSARRVISSRLKEVAIEVAEQHETVSEATLAIVYALGPRPRAMLQVALFILKAIGRCRVDYILETASNPRAST